MKSNIDEVISMAWSDKIFFEEIKKKIGLTEKEVIYIIIQECGLLVFGFLL